MGANLVKANLEGAELMGANLSGATYNKDTVWPARYDPKEAGAKLVQ